MSTSQDHVMGFSDPIYRCDYDGFEGNIIGEYTTREGYHGVVLQHLGSRVVHVYRSDRVRLVESFDAASKDRKAMIDRLTGNLKNDFTPPKDTTDSRLNAIQAILTLHSDRLDDIESVLTLPILTTKPKD